MDADPDLPPPVKLGEGLGDGLAGLAGTLKWNRVFEIEDANVGANRDSLAQSRGISPGREQRAAHSRSELSHGRRHRDWPSCRSHQVEIGRASCRERV